MFLINIFSPIAVEKISLESRPALLLVVAIGLGLVLIIPAEYYCQDDIQDNIQNVRLQGNIQGGL